MIVEFFITIVLSVAVGVLQLRRLRSLSVFCYEKNCPSCPSCPSKIVNTYFAKHISAALTIIFSDDTFTDFRLRAVYNTGNKKNFFVILH
ncbi:MAG: hypothetical protein LBP59_02580 [Planctomycetaceae bacterium]|jgi:hypothetical protein|nr:hypothetical protein [Planctomycetaceae bacterium]